MNHQWDEQYRLLKDDKTRAISEIQMKLKAQMACEEELQGQDIDFERLSQQKTMKIAELNREKEAFSQEIAKMREKQEKTDQLWVSAKKLIDEERDARYSATQQTQVKMGWVGVSEFIISGTHTRDLREGYAQYTRRIRVTYAKNARNIREEHA